MQTATTDSLVGRRLEGRYRILDRIARGGMSTVYAAVDERLDRLVAVKVMNAGLSADPAFSDRFAREARAAARLTHLNAVSVYDQGHEIAPDGHHVFLVMELVEGRTLRELIRERGHLTPAEALSIMEPVLSALSAAHRAGLVHRDVKPENILLSDEGVVKVADFGLARAVETDASSTRTGLMMGTVAYCAPEQLSRGNCDPRSDVYSSGIVFFELLTGTPPYQGDSAMNIAYQHVHSRVPAPSSKVRGLPNELDEIVVAATDSDPAGRPTDAAAFLAEIADARTTLRLPVVGVPPRARGSRSERAERHRTPDEMTTTALRDRFGPRDTTVVGDPQPDGTRRFETRGDDSDGGPPPPVVIPPPRQRKPRDNSPARRRRRGIIAILIILVLGLGAFFGTRAFIAWRFAHIPDVTKLSETAAVAQLKDAGYHTRVQPGPQFSESVPKGDVVDTDPHPGSRFATGKTVTLTLSAGPHLYKIPRLRNKSPEAATAALTALGLTDVSNNYTQVHNRSVDKGLVITTSPGPGTEVRGSRAITLTVSTGPPMVHVPTIPMNTPVDTARALVRKHHLHLGTNRAWSDGVTYGDVIGCQPAADSPVVEGSDVKCTISKGAHLTQVPHIRTGTPIQAAEQVVRQAGLVPQVVSIPPTGTPARVLAVRGQGSTVHWGSTVVIYALPG